MIDLKGKRLLLLGGSLWKDVIQDYAKHKGIVLIATGNDQSAGIFQIAEERYDVDSTDENAMKQLIIDKKIDGVYMGGSEAVCSVACKYLNELGMPCYCTKEQWDFLENKANFKTLCEQFGLPVAKRYQYPTIDHDFAQIDFPVITKPTDGSGSNGFSVCNNFEELRKGYENAKKESPSGSVIVEKFVKNDSVVVFYTFSPDSKRKSPMIRKSLLLSAMLLLGASLSAKNFDLKSPDGRITVSVDTGKQVTYAVSCDGVPLLVNSALGIELAGTHDLSAQPVRHKASSEDRTFRPVVPFKFSSIRDRYNALKLEFRGGWAVEFRAYDDGVAYRILTSEKGTVQVLDETFSIHFPEDYAAVVQQPGSFRTAYEEPYEQVATDEWSAADRLAVLPALLDTRKGYKILISEAGLEDYPCMFLSSARPGSRIIPACS